jgi:hypothetical protein
MLLGGLCTMLAMTVGCSKNQAGLEEFKTLNDDADRYKIPFKAGETCPPTGGLGGGVRILTKSSILYCNDGKPAVVTECKGPKGVSKNEEGGWRCDFSGNAEGDVCHSSVATATCRDKTFIECQSGLNGGAGKIHIETCKGPKGCFISGDMAQCDKS